MTEKKRKGVGEMITPAHGNGNQVFATKNHYTSRSKKTQSQDENETWEGVHRRSLSWVLIFNDPALCAMKNMFHMVLGYFNPMTIPFVPKAGEWCFMRLELERWELITKGARKEPRREEAFKLPMRTSSFFSTTLPSTTSGPMSQSDYQGTSTALDPGKLLSHLLLWRIEAKSASDVSVHEVDYPDHTAVSSLVVLIPWSSYALLADLAEPPFNMGLPFMDRTSGVIMALSCVQGTVLRVISSPLLGPSKYPAISLHSFIFHYSLSSGLYNCQQLGS